MTAPEKTDDNPITPGPRRGWRLGATALTILAAAGAAVGLGHNTGAGSSHTQEAGSHNPGGTPELVQGINEPDTNPGGPSLPLGPDQQKIADDPTIPKLDNHH